MKKSMVRQVNGTNVGIVGYIIEETKVISSSVHQFDVQSNLPILIVQTISD